MTISCSYIAPEYNNKINIVPTVQRIGLKGVTDLYRPYNYDDQQKARCFKICTIQYTISSKVYYVTKFLAPIP